MTTPLTEGDVTMLRNVGMNVAPNNESAEIRGAMTVRVRVTDYDPDKYHVLIVLPNKHQLLLTVNEDKLGLALANANPGGE
jgi:hypothetical protein